MKTVSIWVMLTVAGTAAAEIIDRIAVSVGQQVITESDLMREIRVMALLAHARPDFSEAGKRKTAARLVDQRLVRRELELNRYPAPDPAEATPVLNKFIEEYYAASGAYAKALAEAQVSDAEVREQILWQLTLLRFIQVRFRPGVQVTDDEIKEYFEKVMRPSAQVAVPGQAASIDEYRDRIEETLIEQKVDRDLEAWLKESRQRMGVEYRTAVFTGKVAQP